MAKNTISTPIKDGVMADNSTLSSNEIKKRIDTAAASILPSVTAADNSKVLMVTNGAWGKRPSYYAGKYIFVSNWGGDPSVNNLTLSEFDSLFSTPNAIATCSYTGPESFASVLLIPTGFIGSSIMNFVGYEITSAGAIQYLLTLSTEGSGSSRHFTCTMKKFTLTADT